MTIKIHNSGTYPLAKNIFVKDSGTWKESKQISVKEAGVWKLAHMRTVTLTIAANTNLYNIKTAVESAIGETITQAINIEIIVNSGVIVGSTVSTVGYGSGYGFYRIDTINGPALRLPSLPTGSVVTLVNNGLILGAGGYGGYSNSIVPGAGGTALQIEHAISITNNGTIGGGGGGGTGYYSSGDHVMGGGSGAGSPAGSPQRHAYHGSIYDLPSGTTLLGGLGGNSPFGGNGGGLGLSGVAGSIAPYAAGLAGYYISGNSFVTWATAGDVRGRVI